MAEFFSGVVVLIFLAVVYMLSGPWNEKDHNDD